MRGVKNIFQILLNQDSIWNQRFFRITTPSRGPVLFVNWKKWDIKRQVFFILSNTVYPRKSFICPEKKTFFSTIRRKPHKICFDALRNHKIFLGGNEWFSKSVGGGVTFKEKKHPLLNIEINLSKIHISRLWCPSRNIINIFPLYPSLPPSSFLIFTFITKGRVSLNNLNTFWNPVFMFWGIWMKFSIWA